MKFYPIGGHDNNKISVIAQSKQILISVKIGVMSKKEHDKYFSQYCTKQV